MQPKTDPRNYRYRINSRKDPNHDPYAGWYSYDAIISPHNGLTDYKIRTFKQVCKAINKKYRLVDTIYRHGGETNNAD